MPDKVAMLRESEYELQLFEQLEQAGITGVVWHPTVLDHEVDFVMPGRIIVEVQGQIWKKGAHTWGRGYIRDRRFANAAQIAGWHVLEFAPDCINDGTALETIKAALEKWAQN